MSRLPTDRQLQRLVAGIRDVDTKRIHKRLGDAIKRDRAGTNIPDGYPRSSGMIGGGGLPRLNVDGDTIEFTSVELAVIARTAVHRDHHRHLTNDAVTQLEVAARALVRLDAILGKIENLVDTQDLNPEPGCWAMARIGSWEEIHRTTTVNGQTYRLGRWAYDWVRATGRLPSTKECELHRDGRKIRRPA